MADIPIAITAINNAINLVSYLRGVERVYDVAEYKLKVAELMTTLAEVKAALADAQAEDLAKDSEIKRLKTFLARRDAETIEHKGYRYKKGASGRPQGHAYCPVCEAKEGILIATARLSNSDVCPKCKASFHAHVFGYDE
jgi:hypothetical protein